jgi:hypothetical protein
MDEDRRQLVFSLGLILLCLALVFSANAAYPGGPGETGTRGTKPKSSNEEESGKGGQQRPAQTGQQQAQQPQRQTEQDEYQKTLEEVKSQNLQMGKEVWAKFGATVLEVSPSGIARLGQNGPITLSGAQLPKPHSIPDMPFIVRTIDRKVAEEPQLSKVQDRLSRAAESKSRTVRAEVLVWEVKTLEQMISYTTGSGGLPTGSGTHVARPRIAGARLLIRSHTSPDIRLRFDDGMYVEGMCLTGDEEAFIRTDMSGSARPLTPEQYCLVIASVRQQKGGTEDLMRMAKLVRSEIPPTAHLELELRIIDLSGVVLAASHDRTTGRELRSHLRDCMKELFTTAAGSIPARSHIAVTGMQPKDKSTADYSEKASDMLVSAVVQEAGLRYTILTRTELKTILQEKNLSESDLVQSPQKTKGLIQAEYLVTGSIFELQ